MTEDIEPWSLHLMAVDEQQDNATEAIKVGAIDSALRALEDAAKLCEANPAFAHRGPSALPHLGRLANLVMRLPQASEEQVTRGAAIMRRLEALQNSGIH